MNIGIVGLGLIGGSMAKAFKHYTEDTVLGTNRSREVIKEALLLDAIDLELDDDRIGLCDYIIVSLYPQASIDYIKEKCDLFKPGVIVMDLCGVKKYVCDAIMPLAEKKGFTFIGAHPMAGTHRSGFANSYHNMFRNASMILTPAKELSGQMLDRLTKFWGSVGFSHIEVTTPENHDRVIAYTSQLAHIASNAFIKSPTALDHAGFSAGSYKDLTRVAYLNEDMWTELFMENRENLLRETDSLINELQQYADALRDNDGTKLKALLKEGRKQKERADRNDLN